MEEFIFVDAFDRLSCLTTIKYITQEWVQSLVRKDHIVQNTKLEIEKDMEVLSELA